MIVLAGPVLALKVASLMSVLTSVERVLLTGAVLVFEVVVVVVVMFSLSWVL